MHWAFHSGIDSGETYEEATGDQDDCFYWDHPFDIHYKVNSVRGWPKIVVEVWEVSDEGRYSIAGYGVATIPCVPGQHKILIECWRPVSKGFFGKLAEWLLGSTPELTVKDMLVESND